MAKILKVISKPNLPKASDKSVTAVKISGLSRKVKVARNVKCGECD